MANRLGTQESLQISKMGVIDISDGDWSSPLIPVCIKNDGENPVQLEVNLFDMQEGEYITTYFDCGWNPEIVRSIKHKSGNLDLKWGA